MERLSHTDYPSALAVQSAFRRIRALRSQIASELAGAAVNAGSDIDMADDIENLRSWLDDGDAVMQDAMKDADREVRDASEYEYERRVVPHAVAAE